MRANTKGRILEEFCREETWSCHPAQVSHSWLKTKSPQRLQGCLLFFQTLWGKALVLASWGPR